MAITKAKVCDIKNADINKVDSSNVFALDTNILYWMHYSRCSLAKYVGYQLTYYPNFISDLISNGNKLVTTIYNITELIYIIERNEFEIYKSTNSTVGKKQFRKIVSERADVKIQLESVLLQLKELYTIENFEIKILGIDEFIDEFENHNCDDFDYLIMNYLKSIGINNVISDDGDLITIPGMTVYTANNNIVNEAVSEGRIV